MAKSSQQKAANTMSKSGVFGYELLLDLYGCKLGVCEDLTHCYNFLDEIVGFLGMEKQAPPSIFRSDATRFPDKAGLSGWVPLIESSIVIHTLTQKDFITVDIYCCRSFDQKKAEEFCRRYFGPSQVETQFVERGTKYFGEACSTSTKELAHK